jgi:hypothetical protein
MVQSSTAGRDKRALLLPTYQNRLRVIGHHLDSGGYSNVAIFEIEGGFVARAIPHAGRRPEALEFPDNQFPALMHQAINQRGGGQRYEARSTLLPTGYEDFFRSLGFLLDNQMAHGIMFCELQTHLLVTGSEPSNSNTGHVAYKQFERYLRHDDIQRLLDDAFGRRTDTPRRGGFLGIF